MADKRRIFLVVFIGVIFLATMLMSFSSVRPARDKESERTERQEQPRNEKVSDVHDEVLSYRLQSNERITRLQTALQKAGYYNGEIDGHLGQRTKRAIKKFQKARGLTSDGIAGEKTWKALSQYFKD